MVKEKQASERGARMGASPKPAIDVMDGRPVRNLETTVAITQDVLRQKSRTEWLRLLRGIGVPCLPAGTTAEILDEPQTDAC